MLGNGHDSSDDRKIISTSSKSSGYYDSTFAIQPQSHSPALFCQFTGHVAFADGIVFDFPIGEQFFVHSVRNVRDQVKDDNLQAQIAAFIGQEAMHSQAHTAFNAAWRRDDYNLDRFQAWLARKDDDVKNLHPKIQLAITCAFEHFTALLGGYILRHPEVLSTLDDDAVKLWVWHAIEEIEHRTVAFDVYQDVYGDDKIRRLIMRSVTTGFASLTFYSASRLFLQDHKRVYLNWAGIFLDCIYWRRCLCNCCLNICLTTKPTFIPQILITLSC